MTTNELTAQNNNYGENKIMTLIQAIVLGIVQGLTEFLPVSSSGHLVMTQTLFGITENNLSFAIILHLGTLFAIIIAYHSAVFNMIKQFFLMIGDLFTKRSFNLTESKYRYYIIYIIVATIPAGIVGVLFSDLISEAFSSVVLISFTFALTGIILLVGERIGKSNEGTIEKLGAKKAFIVGLFQMLAITPGISRSGTTMTGGLFMGLKKEDALEFSFLLALPAILGSLLLEFSEVVIAIQTISPLYVLAGFLSAVVVGYGSIKLFNAIVKKGKMIVFSCYLWLLSIVLIIKLLLF